MITRDDLHWWLRTAPRLEWIWAKTYALTAPHQYVVEGRTVGLTTDEYVRAGRVIHTFGRPAKFYGMTSIYLTSPDGRLKWWTMDRDVTDTNLINQATTDRLYGVQNAPITESDVTTKYDALASEYDAANPISPEFADAARAAVTELSGEHRPAILDIGCGTGRVLDLGLTEPERYAGVDPSTPMLNQLVRKHPRVGAVYPMRIQQALDSAMFTPSQFEIVTVFLAETDELDETTRNAIRRLASRGVVTSVGDQVQLHRIDSMLVPPRNN